jgi:hypothetical protein
MSGGITGGFVDLAFFLGFDRVRDGLFALFLVRNWCGRAGLTVGTIFAFLEARRQAIGTYSGIARLMRV